MYGGAAGPRGLVRAGSGQDNPRYAINSVAAAAPAIRADRGCRGAKSDQVNARVLRYLRREPPRHDDSSVELAQDEGSEVVERAAEPGAPEDDIRSDECAVHPANAVLGDLAEHRQSLEHPTRTHRLDVGHAKRNGVEHFYVEQDLAADPPAQLGASIRYLREVTLAT